MQITSGWKCKIIINNTKKNLFLSFATSLNDDYFKDHRPTQTKWYVYSDFKRILLFCVTLVSVLINDIWIACRLVNRTIKLSTNNNNNTLFLVIILLLQKTLINVSLYLSNSQIKKICIFFLFILKDIFITSIWALTDVKITPSYFFILFYFGNFFSFQMKIFLFVNNF